MHLTDYTRGERKAFQEAGIRLPAFDRNQMLAATKAAPNWVHFGGGNIFRAFIASALQTLLDDGFETRGVIVAGSRDTVELYRAHDGLSLLVTLKPDGTTERTLIASVAGALIASADARGDFVRLGEIFAAPSLQMVSFTITEKGYALTGEDCRADFETGPAAPKSFLGFVSSLLHARYLAGARPIALLSMDNCAHNGDMLKRAITGYAEAWSKNRLTEAGFVEYVADPLRVSFPLTMIDKITPRPDDGVREMLLKDGFEDVGGLVTSRRTHAAPFVNAEEAQYLVVEDAFPNARPCLEKAGVIFTDRETVGKVERMKVCTCLNPLHTALAVFGCLLGYDKIASEMNDPDLAALVRGIGYAEGLPVVTDPGVINPKAFIDQVIGARFPNPFLPDTPQRIACDTSQKLRIRFGVTLSSYGNRARTLKFIPLVLAAWCRYLLGIDDGGHPFELSPDPEIPRVKPLVEAGNLKSVLSDAGIFGVNLYEIGLGEKVEALFRSMKAPGQVRAVLHAHTAG